MRTHYFISSLLIMSILLSCSNSDQHSEKANNHDVASSSASPPDKIGSEDSMSQTQYKETDWKKIIPDDPVHENYEIAYLDYIGDHLQRIFIVIDPGRIYDTILIKKTILELDSIFDVDHNSRVSIFSHIKYANYKDNVFDLTTVSVEDTAYQNWMNIHYMAEFDYETMEYRTFPASRLYSRQKKYYIGGKDYSIHKQVHWDNNSGDGC